MSNTTIAREFPRQLLPWILAQLPWLLLLWQALWLVHFVQTATWCCDGSYYLTAARNFWADGLYFADDFSGYRPYLTPLIVGAVVRFPFDSAIFADPNLGYSINAALILFGTSLLLTLLLRRRFDARAWLMLTLPTVFNPFFMADLVVPLQESATLLVTLPALVIIGALLMRARYAGAVFLSVLLVAVVTLSRMQNAVIGLAVLALCAVAWWRSGRRPRVLLAGVGAALLAVLIALPQFAINQHRFGSWHAPLVDEMANLQFQHGADLMRYGTALMDGEWRGVRLDSAWVDYNLATLAEHPYADAGWRVIPHVLTHMFVASHVDEPRTYWSHGPPPPAGFWVIVSSLIAFLGACGIVRDVRHRQLVGIPLALLVVASLASTAMLAVESRFGIWAQIGLALGAARFIFARPPPLHPGRWAAAALAYSALAVLYNIWMWSKL